MTEVPLPTQIPTGRQMIDAVRADPTDRLARLAYADFLDEFYGRETARSRLIRLWDPVAVRRAPIKARDKAHDKVPGAAYNDDHDEVVAAVWALFGPHLGDAGAARRGPGFVCHSGFLEALAVPADVWLLAAHALIAHEPVQCVGFIGVPRIEFGTPVNRDRPAVTIVEAGDGSLHVVEPPGPRETEIIRALPAVPANVAGCPLVRFVGDGTHWVSVPPPLRRGLAENPARDDKAWTFLCRSRWPRVRNWFVSAA